MRASDFVVGIGFLYLLSCFRRRFGSSSWARSSIVCFSSWLLRASWLPLLPVDVHRFCIMPVEPGGSAVFFSAEWAVFLRHFYFCLDWARNRSLVRGKKTKLFKRPSVPAHWPALGFSVSALSFYLSANKGCLASFAEKIPADSCRKKCSPPKGL